MAKNLRMGSNTLEVCVLLRLLLSALLVVWSGPGAPSAERMDWVPELCCACHREAVAGRRQSDLRIDLSADDLDSRLLYRHVLTQGDPFDGAPSPASAAGRRDPAECLELPDLPAYPVPLGCTSDGDEDRRKVVLLEMLREFALEMRAGTRLTQLIIPAAGGAFCETVHCQLLEDLVTLKVDAATCHIVEFPLDRASSVFCVSREGSRPSEEQGDSSERVVIIEFLQKKLRFLFADTPSSQRFLTCMDLLVQRAQQLRTPSSGGVEPALPMAAAVAGCARGGVGGICAKTPVVPSVGDGDCPRAAPRPAAAEGAAVELLGALKTTRLSM
ncbi:unnamed protein product [Prorocentrum cordatum]|uniref:Uncharacterized protein n=1 Tax=Prorocentrum cordatum TaxID=2364126 RepID=A0ABN9QUU5_9DINO|nr:unnamed protein product [Polarella glacialis]